MPSEDPIIEQAQAEAAPTDPMQALYAALAKAQGEAANVTKNAVARLGAGREYHYATLDTMRDALRPFLSANGLAFVGRMADSGILWHLSHVAGGSLEWLTTYPDGATTPQGLGSCVTYLTRYQLALLLGVAAEDDDDAQTAQEQAKAAPTRTPEQAGAKAAYVPTGPEDVETAKLAFFKAWAKAGHAPKDRDARDAFILKVLGEAKWFTKLSAPELGRLIAALDPPKQTLDIEPPDPTDPFSDV